MSASKSKIFRPKAELGLVHASECCVCGAKDNIVTCHNCHQRDYCSPECQEIDWRLHRNMCLRKKDACEVCGTKEGLNSCSGCFQHMYCSTECQKKAWAEHKAICNAYKYVGRDVTDPMEILRKLNDYCEQLSNSNRLESEMRVRTEALSFCRASGVVIEATLIAIDNLSSTLEFMSRFQEAEIFAREMVAESEKVTPIGEIHVRAVGRLAGVLVSQRKVDEARKLAHDSVERFRPHVRAGKEGDAMVFLMEAESSALRMLNRHQEALTITQFCLKLRMGHPERFSEEGKVPVGCLLSEADSLRNLGQLDEAETTLKKVVAMLESDGREIHTNMVHTMSALAGVYFLQGRKKEAAAILKAMKKLVLQVFPRDHPQYKVYMDQ
jgi:tetratricopeptide (TPR) repeat protein